MKRYLTSAGIGKLDARSRKCMDEYSILQSTHSQGDLHRFNIHGYDPALDSIQGRTQLEIASWKGVACLSDRILKLFGMHSQGTVVECGVTTAEIFRQILNRSRGKKVIILDTFYQPWLQRLLIASDRGEIRLRMLPIREKIMAHPARDSLTLASEIARAIDLFHPDIVMLSAVTQGGVRLPWENVIRLAHGYCSKKSRSPVFLVDACQATCRCEIDVSEIEPQNGKLVIIGCCHKAASGPKAVGFVVCNAASFNSWWNVGNERCENDISPWAYAMSDGQAPFLPAFDISGLVAAHVVFNTYDEKTAESVHRSIRINEQNLRVLAAEGGWTIVSPEHDDWQSGIVLIQPPSSLRTNIQTIARVLADGPDGIELDIYGKCLRVAFDMYSPDQVGAELGGELKKSA